MVGNICGGEAETLIHKSNCCGVPAHDTHSSLGGVWTLLPANQAKSLENGHIRGVLCTTRRKTQPQGSKMLCLEPATATPPGGGGGCALP